ncbi:ECT-like protein [Mya arenaria]|uniref:ECT-like protein n=1 Tax=Mya arenaria TaxID=6604 RepID=A0ABY7ER23_MYAAR|nr:ECT-like protein [Mya arenaria]
MPDISLKLLESQAHCYDTRLLTSCFVQTTQTSPAIRYEMGCQNNQLCTSSNLHGGAGIIGRALNTRQVTACHECCLSDNCNERLCAHRKPTACIDSASVDCALLNSLLNVCTDVDHAKTICPKYCGLCSLVDGNWADWSTWSQCDVTCESGTQLRTRTCTNPAPNNGGLDCVGSANQTKVCVKELCPEYVNQCMAGGALGLAGVRVLCPVMQDLLLAVGIAITLSRIDLVTTASEIHLKQGYACKDHVLVRANNIFSRNRWMVAGRNGRLGVYVRRDNLGETAAVTIQNHPYPASRDMVYFIAHSYEMSQAHYLICPTVVDNVGNGYHSNNGSFVAPVSGQYSFSAQICTSDTKTLDVQIRHVSSSGSESIKAINRAHGSGDFDCATVSAPIVLNPSDQVRVYTSATVTTPIYEISGSIMRLNQRRPRAAQAEAETEGCTSANRY